MASYLGKNFPLITKDKNKKGIYNVSPIGVAGRAAVKTLKDFDVIGGVAKGVSDLALKTKAGRDFDQNLRKAGSLGKLMHIPGFKKGGKVKKTGPAMVHKGEVVIPKKKAKKMMKNPSYSQVAKSVRKTMGY